MKECMCLTETAVACLSLARSGEMLTLKTQILLPRGRALSPVWKAESGSVQGLPALSWERPCVVRCYSDLSAGTAGCWCVCVLCFSCSVLLVQKGDESACNVCHSESGVKQDARLLPFVSHDPVRFPGGFLWNEELLLFSGGRINFVCYAFPCSPFCFPLNTADARHGLHVVQSGSKVRLMRKNLHPYVARHAGEDGARANVFYALRHIWLVDFWSLCWRGEGKRDWEVG